MATFGPSEAFPAGTVVGAYPDASRITGQAPSGTARDTATVAADGKYSFTNLQSDTAYVAYAFVNGTHRYVGFTTDPVIVVTGSGSANVVVSTDNPPGDLPAGTTYYKVDSSGLLLGEWVVPS